MHTLRVSFVGICLLLAAGCGKKDDASATSAPGAAAAAAKSATCDSRPQNGKCAEFTNVEDPDVEKLGCDFVKGTWGTAPCPKDQAIASCTKTSSVLYYFKGTPAAGFEVDTDFAQIDCELVSGKLAKLTPPAAAPASAAPKPAVLAKGAPPPSKTTAKGAKK
jgi:hypothetical protein